ncbi:MAG: hypothetical protein DRH44_04485 [Candidatus Coatesbacteria bacterium]|nr:MAG: hypothetical protein DRH49_02685 [Candidatus Coatesbacteria bacterium]RLC43655.1 MAG: hypothetical protein DRH44_04485 [Candidatus Coatesbacteria bacterium]
MKGRLRIYERGQCIRDEPLNSLVENFLRMMRASLLSQNNLETGHDTLKTIDGADIDAPDTHTDHPYFEWWWDGAEELRGIVLGTGTTPVSISDFKLESIIEHGDTPGKLWYGHHIVGEKNRFDDFIVSPMKVEWSAKRIIENRTTSDITANEVGIYAIKYSNANDKDYTVMILRDVLTAPLTIQAGRTIEVEVLFWIEV